jgi:hypothetical protein
VFCEGDRDWFRQDFQLAVGSVAPWTAAKLLAGNAANGMFIADSDGAIRVYSWIDAQVVKGEQKNP